MSATLDRIEQTRSEMLRRDTLDHYEVMGGPPDPAIDDLVELAAGICAAPVAGVWFAGPDRIWIHSSFGFNDTELLPGSLPAPPPMRGGGVFEIADTRLHPGFAPTGIQLEDRIFPFYAAAPLVTPTGVRIGSLFIADLHARKLTPLQLQSLRVFARQAMTSLDLTSAARNMERSARARQRVESALTVERNFVSTVLDTVDALVAVFDTAGRIVRFNRACETASGYDFPSIVGRYLWDKLIPEADVPSAVQHFERLRAGGSPIAFENEWVHRDGSLRRIAWSASALSDSHGRTNFVIATGIDVSVQRAAEEKLRALIRQSNSVLESIGDGICGIDLDGLVTVVNPAAAQMLGYKPEELLGRNMHQLVHHTRPDGTPYPQAECPIQQSTHILDTVRVADEVFWRKDGTSFPVEYVAQPQVEVASEASGVRSNTIRPSESRAKDPAKAVGVVVAFTDTTARRALDRMKDEFISSVSHELRTPLTSLRAALGLVTAGSLDARPDKLQQMLDIAAENTDRLVRLVNDILELERIRSGKAALHYTMCSADDLFRQAARLQQAEAAKAHLRITFEAQSVSVWADPERILQTLANLISNAIKFSSPGGEVHLRALSLDGHEATIEVHDRGRGIPADKLETIFERFHQVDASDSKTIGGTGLGLTICRSIIHQHGGRIWATSRPTQGTTIHFTLPTRPASNLL